jgi:hypothetical protein
MVVLPNQDCFHTWVSEANHIRQFMHTLNLPAVAENEKICDLLRLFTQADENQEIIIDFARVKFYQPGPIVALITRLRHWHEEGKALSAANVRTCPARSYLQRIDFFDQLGIELEESFVRRSPNGQFVQVRPIDNSHVDLISREIAECMARGSDNPNEVQACFSYALGELATNVAQHAYGRGYVCAQHYQDKGRICISVGDCGIGLRKSFAGTSLESSLTSPLQALEKAMEPEVSSALLRPPSGPYHKYVNRGIGLSMVSALTGNTYGRMSVVSENAVFTQVGATSVEFADYDEVFHPGTLVTLSLNTAEIDSFNTIVKDIAEIVTPSELDELDNMFDY